MPGHPSDRVAVGRIVKPHGIRGEVVVALLTDRPERLGPGERLHGAGRTFTVVRSRPHQGRLLVTFEDVADRSAAERVRGTVLEAERGGDREDDTYLASELVGMAVVDDRGRDLGTVDALIELPAAAEYD
ncbi:MAG: ribosome maturation factor RimM, partial [Actinomycetota bacterium]|nr:ribosome maturation factor RimM [Actinomycetota bacterium]